MRAEQSLQWVLCNTARVGKDPDCESILPSLEFCLIKVFLSLLSPSPPLPSPYPSSPLCVYVNLSLFLPFLLFRKLSCQQQTLLGHLTETQKDRSYSEHLSCCGCILVLPRLPNTDSGSQKRTRQRDTVRTEQHRTRTCSLTQGYKGCHPCNQNKAGFKSFSPAF